MLSDEFHTIVKSFVLHWFQLRIIPFNWSRNRAHGGFDRLTDDVYYSYRHLIPFRVCPTIHVCSLINFIFLLELVWTYFIANWTKGLDTSSKTIIITFFRCYIITYSTPYMYVTQCKSDYLNIHKCDIRQRKHHDTIIDIAYIVKNQYLDIKLNKF